MGGERKAGKEPPEGSLEVMQVLPETSRHGIALHRESAYSQPCPEAGEQSAQHWPSCPKRSCCSDSALNAEAKAFLEVRGYSEITQVNSLTGPFWGFSCMCLGLVFIPRDAFLVVVSSVSSSGARDL